MGIFCNPLTSIIPLLCSSFSSNSVMFPSATTTDQIIQESKKLYQGLKSAGAYNYTASPTIQFSFVPPPPSSLSSSFNISIETSNIDNTNEHDDLSVFERVRATYSSSDNIKNEVDDTTIAKQKPIALFLPGLDGVGISTRTQYDDLSSNFELWRLIIDPKSDRTSFHDLITTIVQFLDDATKDDISLTSDDSPTSKVNAREVLLIGDSFGGLLAPNVALRMQRRVQRRMDLEKYSTQTLEYLDPIANITGLVMVNPATSYDETQWSTLAPLLTSLRYLTPSTDKDTTPSSSTTTLMQRLPTPYSVLGGLALALTIPDSKQLTQIIDLITTIIQSEYLTSPPSIEQLEKSLDQMKEGFDILEDNLPADTLEHRITKWFPVGLSVLNPNLSKLNVRSIVIAGSEDNMLPSKQEATRLQNLMPDCQKVEIAGSGHFVLDDRVNLTDIILSAEILPSTIKDPARYDPILDWKPPTTEAYTEMVNDRVKPLRHLTSPIFFSTDQQGRRKKGLSHVPSQNGGPLLFVANHQLLGQDLGMIISQLVDERDIWIRGLAHPIIFGASNQLEAGENNNRNDMQSQRGTFETYGALKVTPRNYYRLMETKQNGLLFPGGVREVFHGKGEEYQLFWPEKVDFVRTAAKFNATIIPLSALGSAESLNILVDAPDMAKLPFVGERIANSSASTVAGRFDTDANDELFTPPFVVPGLPARHYFMFGRPMNTAHIDHRDKAHCEQLYRDIKDEMNRGFSDVLKARENDPYKDTLTRLALERITGKPSPTFGMEEFD